MQPQGLAPGVYPALSNEAYHNDPAIGSSGIKDLLIDPEVYWFGSVLNPDRPEFDGPAFRVGRAYHAMVLEPEKDFPFKIKPGVQTSKVDGMIGEGDYKMLLKMYHRLPMTPKHWNALHGGIAECSIFWRDERTGLMCKCRPDNFAPEWVSDLKTIADMQNLRYDFVKMGYYISGTMYSQGMQALKKMIRDGYVMPEKFDKRFIDAFMARETQMFCFIFQEKDTATWPSPNTTRLWNMTPYVAEIGYHKFITALDIYVENMHTIGRWKSKFDGVEDITEDMVSAGINY
jgi:exodeoxyribonuclease VIII